MATADDAEKVFGNVQPSRLPHTGWIVFQYVREMRYDTNFATTEVM